MTGNPGDGGLGGGGRGGEYWPGKDGKHMVLVEAAAGQ